MAGTPMEISSWTCIIFRNFPMSIIIAQSRTIVSEPKPRGRERLRGTTMLMVSTYLAPSAIEGLGVFAGEFIERGRLV